MAKDLTWKKAIDRVLSENGSAMHYKDIAAQIISDGLRKSVGATPGSTVNAYLSSSIKNDGDKSAYRKVGRGEYVLRTTPHKAGSTKAVKRDEDDDTEEQYAIISSFGMFWRRDLVNWSSSAQILGMQQIGSKPVNFSKQMGIYLLYDGREVIYVGRSTDRPLGKRLHEHTVDRLATRWDRFSWFGLLPVSPEGNLGSLPPTFAAQTLVPALEAVLIEALEPRQNRKRGDDLAAVEYLQTEDPQLEKKKRKEFLEELINKS